MFQQLYNDISSGINNIRYGLMSGYSPQEENTLYSGHLYDKQHNDYVFRGQSSGGVFKLAGQALLFLVILALVYLLVLYVFYPSYASQPLGLATFTDSPLSPHIPNFLNPNLPNLNVEQMFGAPVAAPAAAAPVPAQLGGQPAY